MQTKTIGGKVLLEMRGEINATAGAEYKKTVIRMFDSADIFVLSFRDVVYLNSSGLREIIDLFKKATQARKELRLCSMSKDIREMFGFTGLEKIFKIYDTQQAALE